MKTKYYLISLLFCTIWLTVYGQQSGNSVYGQGYTKGKMPGKETLYLSDSTFIIEASVLQNVIADGYVATFGLAEEATTLKECNEKIDKRIKDFTSQLTKMGVAKTDIYVDMTSQNKVYDYKITGEVAEEYLQGFELKKNVIVKFNHISDLDQMVIMASNLEIYDLVKVDYIVNDLNAIHTQLLTAASEIISQKKTLYAALTNAHLSPTAEIYGDQFYSFYPDQLYASYQAFESGNISGSGYNNTYTTKDARKSATYYYDKINYSGFDKVINPYVTEPAVEFVITLQIKFEIE
ncbi:MAG: SIMPL domain-containing protein [Saprospiraceae bacterium]|uniref:SIMPL domain-containing protein n=1 Tax=Candidatus Opimibacter skivensis TaxID=2982028 RepID=A0A9D7SR65_9BACT|nr:SIMPL domain-containing protein [Candidatus Opimibacter skivensis]